MCTFVEGCMNAKGSAGVIGSVLAADVAMHVSMCIHVNCVHVHIRYMFSVSCWSATFTEHVVWM